LMMDWSCDGCSGSRCAHRSSEGRWLSARRWTHCWRGPRARRWTEMMKYPWKASSLPACEPSFTALKQGTGRTTGIGRTTWRRGPSAPRPRRPRLLALAARGGARLRALWPKAPPRAVMMTLEWPWLEEGRQSLGSHVPLTRKAQSSQSGPSWARTYLPRGLRGAIGGDIRGEELRDTGHLDGRTHGPHDLRGDLARVAAERHGVVEAAGTLDTGELCAQGWWPRCVCEHVTEPWPMELRMVEAGWTPRTTQTPK
jgi:hypothetical protein